MSLRDQFNGPLGLVAGLAILGAAVGLYFTLNADDNPQRLTHAWYFYDLNAKSLISKPTDTPSPTDSGNALRAYVYSCTDCAVAKSHFIAYLEQLTPEATAGMNDPALDHDQRSQKRLAGWQLRTVESTEWLPATSPQGRELMDSAWKRCGKEPKPCDPD
jgi:hypothetical protein